MRPLSGRIMPAITLSSVDLPAPLWPTRPSHSPTPIERSTPFSARTAPKCFSAPVSWTMVSRDCVKISPSDGKNAWPQALLGVGLDHRDRVGLRIFMAGDATLGNGRQSGLEIILAESQIRHGQVV